MKVVIGVTTTKARLGLFFYTLQSLKKQKYRDFTISINLSKEPYLFDDGIEAVPDWMTGENVQINFVKNSGPYRKLIPVLEQIEGDDIIVTADDDVLYSEDWLKKIMERALQYPDYIVCGRARRIKKNVIGRFQNYANWPLILNRSTDLCLLPIGVSGIAYRAILLDLEFVRNVAYLEYAPTVDDMWFRLASIRKNTSVFVDPEIDEGNVFMQHSLGLEQVNLHRHKRMHRWYERVIVRLIDKIVNYFGVPMAKNDLLWNRALKFSTSKKSGGQL